MDKTHQGVPGCVKQRFAELIIISFVGIEYHYQSERFITDSDLLAKKRKISQAVKYSASLCTNEILDKQWTIIINLPTEG